MYIDGTWWISDVPVESELNDKQLQKRVKKLRPCFLPFVIL
jgi:hypothetical protein